VALSTCQLEGALNAFVCVCVCGRSLGLGGLSRRATGAPATGGVQLAGAEESWGRKWAPTRERETVFRWGWAQ